MDFRRAIVRPQKGIFCKSIRFSFETKRACVGFELHENNLLVLVDMGISSLAEDGKIQKKCDKALLIDLTLVDEPKESSVSSVILMWKSNRFRVKLYS